MIKVFARLVFGGMVGKVLGLAREVLLAALFGAGRVVAAQRIALTGTLIPINFFTADALTAGFLPLYVQYHKERSPMTLVLYRTVRAMLAVFSLVLLVALVFGRGLWVDLLGPGLDAGTAHIAASMLAIAAVGVPFYIQYNLYTLVGLANDDVRLINIRASFQSIGLIGATLAAYETGNFALIAWGFTVPYALLCGLGTVWVHRRGYLRDAGEATALPVGHWRVALGMFWQRLRPLLLIPVILQGSIAVERAVGSLLGVEVVAGTEYARFVVDSCMTLLAAPLGLVGLASFARMHADEVAAGLRRMVPPLLLLSIPLTLLLSLNSTGIVRLLYARGEFDQQAVDVSSVMLLGFALGIWAQVVGYTFVKILNARAANREVAIVMAVSFGASIVANLLLYRFWGAFTLGFSSSVCGLLMFAISALRLGILRYTARLAATLVPGAALAAVVGYLLSGTGLVHVAASCSAIVLVFLLYVYLVPQLRAGFLDPTLDRLQRKRGRHQAVTVPGQRTETGHRDAEPRASVNRVGRHAKTP